MASTTFQRILVTGAAGKVARSVLPWLAPLAGELRLTDIVAFGGDAAPSHPFLQADLAQPEAAARVVDGVDAIVHFAGHPREAPWSVLVDANLRTAAHLWDAAVAAGVRRIVHASSNHAVGYCERSRVIGPQEPPRPDSRYGVTKVFMEALAQLHADKHGVRAFGIRIGHCSEAPRDARMLANWIHPEDLAQLIGVGLTAEYRCEIVYGVSDNRASWYDNRRAESLGYRPRHSADRWAAALAGVVEDDPVARRFQGGAFAAADHVGTLR
jgi:uronate dehydrogenase